MCWNGAIPSRDFDQSNEHCMEGDAARRKSQMGMKGCDERLRLARLADNFCCGGLDIEA